MVLIPLRCNRCVNIWIPPITPELEGIPLHRERKGELDFHQCHAHGLFFFLKKLLEILRIGSSLNETSFAIVK